MGLLTLGSVPLRFTSVAKHYQPLMQALAVPGKFTTGGCMKKQNSKPQLKESSSISDLFRMQTEVGLLESMSKSKALTIMVIAGILLFSGFFYFLFKMAGG